jgi:Holliday junction resolvase RusA-like endonuclease
MTTLELRLPTPPSVNHLFATIPGKNGPLRVKSEAYKSWQVEAGYAPGWQRLTEDRHNAIPWRCEIVAYGLAAARDVDNLIKPTLDLICTMTGLRDNAPLREVRAQRVHSGGGGNDGHILVRVEVLG